MNQWRLAIGPHSVVRLLVSLVLVFIPVVAGAAVEVGDKAPDFELPSTMRGKIRLSDFAGKKNVIIEFHVLDFAPV
ncbi:MAG: redoxin domain-containing protein [candidate division NC10 bacterium]|nr:redoxin domain-containing protein [candidate division NC10 bacterium]